MGVNKNTTVQEENNMKKNLTELVFILDRSGSMAGLEEYPNQNVP